VVSHATLQLTDIPEYRSSCRFFEELSTRRHRCSMLPVFFPKQERSKIVAAAAAAGNWIGKIAAAVERSCVFRCAQEAIEHTRLHTHTYPRHTRVDIP